MRTLTFMVIIAISCMWLPLQARAVERTMVVTAHPLASRAGHEIIRAGGSGVDAAIAAQMVLTLVEPQSSGIGGGAFLVHYAAASESLEAFDGRETAPMAATANLFIGDDGQPMKWSEARIGGRSVGVPGTVRMLELAHEKYGKLPWNTLFEPAIRLARDGFAVSQRLHDSIVRVDGWEETPSSARYFLDGEGNPLPIGHTLKNPALAETLAMIGTDARALNQGVIASDVVQVVRNHRSNPGVMTEADLAAYAPQSRAPVCGNYLTYRVCGMPPPSSGPVTVLMMIGMAERLGMHSLSAGSAVWAHMFAEVSRVAFADRNAYLADPDFVPQPVAGLLDPRYLDRRAGLISIQRALGSVAPGNPPTKQGYGPPGSHPGLFEAGTSHISIVDATGNIVSMTTTIESAFGSRLMVRGFLLNNELTDFSFLPERNGKPVANRVAAGKRPRSSMAPIIVFDEDGRPALVTGSPGGSRIIAYTAASIIRILGNGMTPQAAVEAGHIVNRNTTATELESGTAAAELADALEERGHTIKVRSLTSGLHVVRFGPQGLEAGVDPRREGLALGD